MNPLHLIDDLLADYLSARARRTVHTLLLLAALVATVWLAADGDWKEALVTLAASLYAGANRANTPDDGDNEPGLSEDTEGGIVYVDDVPPTEEEIAALPTDEPHGGQVA